jgi:hypothetical protein
LTVNLNEPVSPLRSIADLGLAGASDQRQRPGSAGRQRGFLPPPHPDSRTAKTAARTEAAAMRRIAPRVATPPRVTARTASNGGLLKCLPWRASFAP